MNPSLHPIIKNLHHLDKEVSQFKEDVMHQDIGKSEKSLIELRKKTNSFQSLAGSYDKDTQAYINQLSYGMHNTLNEAEQLIQEKTNHLGNATLGTSACVPGLEIAYHSTLQIPPSGMMAKLKEKKETIRELELKFKEDLIMANCDNARNFTFVEKGRVENDGMNVLVKCTLPGHPVPEKIYDLNLSFSFNPDLSFEQGIWVNEYLELARLPNHPNILRYICNFSDTIPEEILFYLPEDAKIKSRRRVRGGIEVKKKTMFFVKEHVGLTLDSYLKDMRSTDSGIPLRLSSKIISDIGHTLLHIQKYKLALRNLNPKNVFVKIDESGEIKCLLGNFKRSCELNEQFMGIASITEGGYNLTPSWQYEDSGSIAPELNTALNRAIRAKERAVIFLDYSNQPVFELGVLAYEIFTGQGPIKNYPESCLDERGNVKYDDQDISRLTDYGLNELQIELLHRSVSFNPLNRPSLEELVAAFDETRTALDDRMIIQTDNIPSIVVLDKRIAELRAAQEKLSKSIFMKRICRELQFKLLEVFKNENEGMHLQVKYTHPFFKDSKETYELKVCLNFDREPQGIAIDYINESSTLAKLPPHNNIAGLVCIFVNRIPDEIKTLLSADFQNRNQRRLEPKAQFSIIEHFPLSLKVLLENNPCIAKVEILMEFVEQTACGLLHLKEHHIAHNNLSLDHIGIELDETEKVIRFVIKDFERASKLNDHHLATLSITQEGKIGSLMWSDTSRIAPELLSKVGAAVRAERTDDENIELNYANQPVYELGVLAYELMTGKGPVENYPNSCTDRETGEVKYSDDEIKPLLNLNPALADLLKRAVAFDPAKRPTLEELVNEIQTMKYLASPR